MNSFKRLRYDIFDRYNLKNIQQQNEILNIRHGKAAFLGARNFFDEPNI